MDMKIAIATSDRSTISDHLGGAPYFAVVTVEDGKVEGKEFRGKPGHSEFAGEEESPQLDEEGRHGFSAVASNRHKDIRDAIEDCDVVIARRMGLGAYQDLKNMGLEVITTNAKGIDEAVELYVGGKLEHLADRVC
jgi:predicted Fe-Mo cluster-binding NifX family protein